ncbi:VOC family protein [Vulcanococcus sp.]|uniref:VOC family protein n=1 Tax=Vulcanococcus sp. TaxID=2856995 RepID=UPI003C0DA670
MPSLRTPTCSLVLAADDVAGLASFYGSLLAATPQAGASASHWRLPLPGGLWLDLYCPSRERPLPRQRGRLALCLQLEGGELGLRDAVQRCLELGGRCLEQPRQESFGWECWLQDLEGNSLLLLAP